LTKRIGPRQRMGSAATRMRETLSLNREVWYARTWPIHMNKKGSTSQDILIIS